MVRDNPEISRRISIRNPETVFAIDLGDMLRVLEEVGEADTNQPRQLKPDQRLS